MTKEEIGKKLDEWIEQQRLDEYAKKTLIDYRHGVQLFIDWITEDEFTINKSLMLNYKDYLAESFAVNSRNKYIIEINKFLKYIGYNDCTLKKFKTQIKTSIDDPIWEQEHNRMLRWAKKLDLEDMYMIMECFAHCGCRVYELKYFTVESLESNIIKRVENKGKERVIILTNELRRKLINYCKKNNITEGYIFKSPEKPGQMICSTTIWRRLKKIARAAKINPDKIHPHSWRHLFAKKCKENGIDLDELKDILGHSDIKTTAIYTMTSTTEKKKKLEKIKYGRSEEL